MKRRCGISVTLDSQRPPTPTGDLGAPEEPQVLPWLWPLARNEEGAARSEHLHALERRVGDLEQDSRARGAWAAELQQGILRDVSEEHDKLSLKLRSDVDAIAKSSSGTAVKLDMLAAELRSGLKKEDQPGRASSSGQWSGAAPQREGLNDGSGPAGEASIASVAAREETKQAAPTPRRVREESCIDISGVYTDEQGALKTFHQMGRSGICVEDAWTYLVSGSTVSLDQEGGATGTILGSKGLFAISWFGMGTYTQLREDGISGEGAQRREGSPQAAQGSRSVSAKNRGAARVDL